MHVSKKNKLDEDCCILTCPVLSRVDSFNLGISCHLHENGLDVKLVIGPIIDSISADVSVVLMNLAWMFVWMLVLLTNLVI